MQELDMDVSLKVIVVGNGMVGKCWGVGTQIIMADGSFKTVEKIQSGDLLMGDDGTYRTVQPGSIHRGNTQRDAQLFMAGDSDSTLQRSMVDGQFQWATKQSSPSIAPAMYRITSHNKSRDSFTCNGDHILVLSLDTAPSAIEQESADSFVFHQLRFENGLVQRQTNRFSTRASAELAHSSAIGSHQPFVWECSINDFLQCDEYVRSCACMFQPNEPIAFHPTGQLSLQQRLSAAMGVEATQQQAQEMAWSLGLWLSLGSGMESTSPSIAARLSSCYHSVGGPVMMQRLLESYHLIDGGKIAYDLLTESIDIRMKLMAGLIDASQSYDVACQSSVMCDDVLHLARGLGLSASIQSAAVVAISGRNLDRLALTQRPAGAVPHQPLASTFTIDKIDHADYYGFTLDGNGRCLLGSFIITHNTSMITRFARGIATDNYKKTIGTDFMEKEITTRRTGETIKLMLWDTAGQEMFSQLTRNYYRGAGAVVFVFSTTDRDSFLEIERWKSKVEAECGQICQVLVQNKIDLLEKAQMTSQEVEDLARRMGIKLYRTCVKDNVLVDEVFDYLADSFLKQGGSSAFGVESVTNIGDLNTNTSATGSSSSSSSAISSSPLVGSTGTGPGASKSNEKPNNVPSSEKAQSSAPFQLTPLTVRTDGKKKSMCTIL